MKFFTDGRAVYSHVQVPEHLCGWRNIVHGGVLTTILDEVMSWSAIYILKRIALTQTINVDFIKPVQVGSDLRAEARVREANAKNNAITEGVIYDPTGDTCARASGNFKVFSPSVARRLGIADEASIRWFEWMFDTEG